jgi:hypothetical protein
MKAVGGATNLEKVNRQISPIRGAAPLMQSSPNLVQHLFSPNGIMLIG